MRLPLAREGWPFLIAVAALGVAAFWWRPWAGLPFLLLLLFFAWFFRDPERVVPDGADTFVSPADGKVMSVRTVHEPRFLQSEATLVTIFLNVTDVHVNRVPAAGVVRYLEYVPGKYVVAFADKAAEINERNYIGLETDYGRLLVCQIAGFVARRIVCWRGPGDRLAKGERFGLIKFGSCLQVWLPPGVAAAVQPGERVQAGVTVIGRAGHEA